MSGKLQPNKQILTDLWSLLHVVDLNTRQRRDNPTLPQCTLVTGHSETNTFVFRSGELEKVFDKQTKKTRFSSHCLFPSVLQDATVRPRPQGY